jgi:histidine triad (HIT) family protein
MSCVFCKILESKISMNKIYETDKVLAFLDVHPITDGHTLLIPKIHVTMLEDLPDDYYFSLFQVLKKLIKPIERATGSSASQLSINNGHEAGQIIPHVHIHIIPIKKGSDIRVLYGIDRKSKLMSQEYFDTIVEKILCEINF